MHATNKSTNQPANQATRSPPRPFQPHRATQVKPGAPVEETLDVTGPHITEWGIKVAAYDCHPE
jgi:hypothetical protein